MVGTRFFSPTLFSAGKGPNKLLEREKLKAGLLTRRDQVEADEGGGFVGRDAAVFLEPLFFVEAFGANF